MGTYSISRMMKKPPSKPGCGNHNSNRNTYRKVRQQATDSFRSGRATTGRTYNYGKENIMQERQSRSKGRLPISKRHHEEMDSERGELVAAASRYNDEYEPISRSYIEQRNKREPLVVKQRQNDQENIKGYHSLSKAKEDLHSQGCR